MPKVDRSLPDEDGAPREDSLDRVEELVVELIDRYEREGTAALESLCRANPSSAEELRAQFEILRESGVLEEEAGSSPFPERLGKYRLLERLGGGGMGVVFLAEEEPVGRRVALKLIRPEQMYFEGSRRRFQREMEAVARLQHPSIVPVYSLEEVGGVPFYVMERIEGCTLAEILRELEDRDPADLRGEDFARVVHRKIGRPDAEFDVQAARRDFGDAGWRACTRLVLQIAEALDHAHRRGVLHRDVKPSNIMVTAQGRALLMDFGLARVSDVDELTRTGAVLGSLPYMAPEQVRGESSENEPRSDLYSLGVTYYEMLALRLPYFDEDRERLRQLVLHGQPPSLRRRNRSLSWEVETICLAAMSLEPARRYATAAAFARDLHNALESRTIVARRPGLILRGRRWIQRHPTLSVFLLLCFSVPAVFAVQSRIALNQIRKAQKETEDVKGERDDFRSERESFKNDGLRLYYASQADELLAWERRLWPAVAARIEGPYGMSAWVRNAEETVLNITRQVKELKPQVRSRGRPCKPEDLDPNDPRVARLNARLDELVAERDELRRRAGDSNRAALESLDRRIAELEYERREKLCWSFDDPRDAFWNENLVDLEPRLDQLIAAGIRVHHRMLAARVSEAFGSSAEAARWEKAQREIAELEVYRGLSIAPQPGLVPLGVDPVTGLYHFADVVTSSSESLERILTETSPRSLPEDGRIFVLLPRTELRWDGEFWRVCGEEAAELRLDAFLISRSEVTCRQWSRVAVVPDDQREATDLPVVGLSWSEVEERLFDQAEFLPTMLQWWVAAAGGTDPTDLRLDVANLTDRTVGESELFAPGTSGADAQGLEDLVGNAAEWVLDRHRVGFPPRDGDGRALVDRRGPVAAMGGSFRDLRTQLEFVRLLSPWSGNDDVGFRSVRPLRR